MNRTLAWLVVLLGLSGCGKTFTDADASNGAAPDDSAGSANDAGLGGGANDAGLGGGAGDRECADAIAQFDPIVVTTQAELDALPLIVRAGDIQIKDDVTNLQRFKCLESATSIEIAHSKLLDLHGLERLDNVSGLDIHENNDLKGLNGLGLRDVISLVISANPSLQSLDGLHLQRAEVLVITQQDALTDLAGLSSITETAEIRISDDGGLTNLSGLPTIANIVDNVSILSCARLSSLTGLEELAGIGNLEVSQNPALTSLGPRLNVVQSLSLVADPRLTDFGAVQDLPSLDNLVLDGVGLTSLEALGKFSHLSQLTLAEMPLVDLSGLEKLTIGSLYLDGNPQLRSLAGLNPATEGFGSLQLYKNPALEDLSALSAMRHAESLLVYGNDSLSSLAGLEQLNSLTALDIKNNPKLTSLSALQSLDTVLLELTISGNALLPACQAQALADRVQPPRFDVSGNLVGGTCD